MTMFNYRHGSEAFNDNVEETVAFAAAQLEGKILENADERKKNLCYSVSKDMLSGTRYEKLFEEKGLDAMKDPRVIKNGDVQENFNAFIAQIINPILPMVSNLDFVRFFAEVRQVGYGDTARFIVRSNELYKVNEIASGVNRGILQPIHDDEITVNASPIEIAAEIDFYAVAAGVFDFGYFGLRAARSFEAYIFAKVVGAMTSATTKAGAAYSASGFNNGNWSALAQKVSAAAGGADVFAIGTLAALNSVIPATAGLQYGLGQKIADQGYLDRYLGTRMICLDQALTFNSVNTTADFVVPDNKIYMLPVYGDKPIKIVYEGDQTVVEKAPDYTPDRTYRIRIQMRVGVAAIVGSKFGTMTL